MAYNMIATKSGGPEVLQKNEFEITEPGAGEVLIRQTAIGVNFIDVYFRSGLYPWPVDNNLVLGSEAAGIIEAISPDVNGFSVGDRVVYTLPNNAYTTHRIIDAQHIILIPDGISDETAAASILKGLTTYYLLHNSFQLKVGNSVLFHAAAGGVGLIAGQWMKSLGINAIGTAGSDEKCKLAMEHGYAQMINYRDEDFVKRVRELTDGECVDVVYDSVGKDTYPGSLNCLKKFGTMVNFGQSSGPATDFKLADLAVGSYTVTRPILYHFTEDRSWLENATSSLFNLILKGDLNISINQRFPLDQVTDAHRMLEERKTTGCTILLP
ncbi:MAG: quinone oxidoreductase [Kordiimonadaceae bacterium]|jgi:NADPH:quinone reductase|nr:quinone oxidoreductase [Kordiimonadaceae bacterium]MBT6033181.1 quinone oxidoreductase [Kordiimonadaceae bacterium]